MLINKDWKRISLLAILMGVVEALAALGYIFILGQLVEVAVNKRYIELVIYSCSAVVLFFIQELFKLIYELQIAKLVPQYEHKTRGLLLTKWFLMIPKRKVEPGQVYNGLFNDLTQVVSTQLRFTYTIAFSVTMLSIATAVLFYLHWLVGVVTISVALITLISIVLTGGITQKSQAGMSAVRGSYYGNSKSINFNKDQFIHMRLLGLYLKFLKGEYNVYRKAEMKFRFRISAFNDVVVALLSLSVVVPLIVAAVLYGQQNLTYGAIVMIMFLGERVVIASVSSIDSISEYVGMRVLRAKYKLKEVNELKSLAYEGVSPVFAGDDAPRNALTLSIAPSGKYLWKGPNGVGKSTLLELLDRNIDYAGSLVINGEKVTPKEIEKYALTRPLKTGTIFTSEPQISAALDVTANALYQNALSLIAHHADLSRESTALSQGETQLLSLLHALATKPPVLILDEAITSVSKALREALYDFLLKQEQLALIVVDHALPKAWERRFDEVTIFSKEAISHHFNRLSS